MKPTISNKKFDINTVPDLYECPKCKGTITYLADEADFLCDSCNHIFKYTNGVVDFDLGSVLYKSGDRTYDVQMKSILEHANKVGWMEAMKCYDSISSRGQSKCEYATNLSRVDFKFLLPFNKSSSVLDVGGGHGLISIALARSVKQVYTIEKLKEQAEFIALRAKQESINNVFVSSGGANCSFPYKDECFDLIILNGVFEWIGFESDFSNVVNYQKRLLREIKRVLKKDGVVWLTTKNKYSLSMIFSRNLHNNMLPFISILPDKMVNFLSNILRHKEYLSGLKSVAGYKKMFASEGFENINVWMPQPSFRYPAEYICYDSNKYLTSPTNFNHMGKAVKAIFMLLPWFLTKRILYSHAFILRKTFDTFKSKKLLINKIIASVPGIEDGYASSLICPKSSSLSSSVIIFVKKARAKFLIKMNRYEGLNYLESEQEKLKDIRSKLESSFDILPEIISSGYIDGFNYSVQKYYKGYSTFSNVFIRKLARRIVRDRLIKQLMSFLIDLANKTKKSNTLSFICYVKEPIERLLNEKDDKILYEFAQKCINHLSKCWSEIQLVFEHGDMQPGNIIIQRLFPLQFKLIDWESGTLDGFPGTDLYTLLERCKIDKRLQQRMLEDYCKQIGIDMHLIRYLSFVRLIRSRESQRTRHGLGQTFEWMNRESNFNKKLSNIMEEPHQ